MMFDVVKKPLRYFWSFSGITVIAARSPLPAESGAQCWPIRPDDSADRALSQQLPVSWSTQP